jgi:hypothetical protein
VAAKTSEEVDERAGDAAESLLALSCEQQIPPQLRHHQQRTIADGAHVRAEAGIAEHGAQGIAAAIHQADRR